MNSLEQSEALELPATNAEPARASFFGAAGFSHYIDLHMDTSEQTAIRQLLAEIPELGALPEAALLDVAASCVRIKLDASETFPREGSSVYFCVILSGELRIYCGATPAVSLPLYPGAVIADPTIADPTIASALPGKLSWVAHTKAEILCVPWSALNALPNLEEDLRKRIASEQLRLHLQLHLAANPLFATLDQAELSDVAAHSEVGLVERGEIVIHEGRDPDYFYVIVRGSLEVFREHADGTATVIEVLHAGACAGEMGVLTQEPRSASVRAHRDSILIRVSGRCFEEMLHRNARLTLGLARTLSDRLKRTTSAATRKIAVKTIALVQCGAQPAFASFCKELSHAFAASGDDVAVLSSASGQSKDLACDYELYVCAEDAPAWTAHGIRQADLILCVATLGGDEPLRALPDGMESARKNGSRIELVLLRSAGEAPRGTCAWLDAVRYDAHHHVAFDSGADCARLVRRTTAKALGMVLSGGGARGFAHIGVLQALRESGVAVDMIAGTSMGAVLAALYAMGCDTGRMVALARKAFVGKISWVPDLTFPFVSMTTGNRTMVRFTEMFGNVQIEDLPIPYFCVSCNLTRARSMVHESGPLAMWTRVSGSIPGLLPPVAWDGNLLVDGGLLDNLPVGAMRKRVQGSVAASDVSAADDMIMNEALSGVTSWSARSHIYRGLLKRPRMPSIGELLMRMVGISSVRDGRAALSPADLYFRPPVEEFGMTQFEAIDRIVELGYVHAKDRLNELKLGAVV